MSEEIRINRFSLEPNSTYENDTNSFHIKGATAIENDVTFNTVDFCVFGDDQSKDTICVRTVEISSVKLVLKK